MSFWEVMWFIFVSFAFVAYLMMLFHIIGDVFRDRQLSGGSKALWMIALVLVPLITATVYLIARGQGMAERRAQEWATARAQQDEYIRSVAGTSPSEEIDRAASLMKAGTIDQAEYEALKLKALS